ncbi:MAG: carbohydrate kinase family protein [Solirubrobacterales bacterium]
MPLAPAQKPILCLGEAIVDLVCDHEAATLGDATAFSPHFGGALANVAVSARRHGAPAALAGGVGDDEWGQWLRRRLEAEGVGLRWFSLVAGLQTPVAFVTFGPGREPAFSVYGDGISAGVQAVAPHAEEAVAGASGLVFGSNTLVGEAERRLTLRARDFALEIGTPVVFDPNIRANRWDEIETALERCRDAARGARIVRANLAEARAMAGLSESAGLAKSADALCELGCRVAVVTAGADGALARGEVTAEAAAPAVEVVSPLGAGDAFLGALVAGAARGGWGAQAIAAALPAATLAGARACEALEAVA